MIISVIGLVVVAGFLFMLGLTVFDLIFRPSMRRLALRNIARRPGEAVLVVLGSLLGTAIITAAFIVGDTFEASNRDVGRRLLGPVDEEVVVSGLDSFDDIVAAVRTELEGRDDVDGILPMVSGFAAVADTSTTDRRAEPVARVGEVDFDEARAFGNDVGASGLEDAGDTPSGTAAVIGSRLADTLDVEVGDDLELFAYGQSRQFTVRTILDETGLGGYRDVYVPSGTIEGLAAASRIPTAAPPTGIVAVSNTGDVFSGADLTVPVVDALENAVDDVDGVSVVPVKDDILEEAKEQGDSIGQLFFSIGTFSVLVGILLLVNLFVMLSEERKTELGMLRAVGMKRNHLLRSFSLEGAVYSVLASTAGGFVGIGVGWVIGQVTQGIIGGESPGFRIVLNIVPASIITGMLIGLVISLITVWLTSARIARLNVITAIRDLPEPSTSTKRARTLVLSGFGAVLGLLLLQAGLASDTAIPTLAGPPIALLSSIPLLHRFVGQRLAVASMAGASLAWGILIFTIVGEATDNAGIEVFVVQGVVLVSSAVLLVSAADHLWVRTTDFLIAGGRGLATRLALAYPLARKVRTGILLAMFSLIMFTMTFMSVFTNIFGAQAKTFADKDRGGFDVFVDSNPSNPATVEQLTQIDGVTKVAPLIRSFPEFTSPYESDPTFWSTAGFDERLIDGGAPKLSRRLPEFADDEAVFRAILADPELAIVPDFFLQQNGPPENTLKVGEQIVMFDARSDETLTLTVAGMTDADFVFNGVMVGRPTLEGFLGDQAVENRHYIGVADGVDPEELAVRLDGALLTHGAEAEGFRAAVETELAEQQGFFRLMQGYLGLGLVIGIAGLGVVMIRAVRERRRQVGMLRAMGFSAGVVRRAFLLEAGFIAAQGVSIGIGLGLVTAYQVLTNSSAFGDQTLPFSIPWGPLAIIVVLPLIASLLATVTPAAQAARIRPAAALRIAD